jgi:hypothetical protein
LRSTIEHTVRFCKQTLGWTIPRPRTPEQADRWTWLVLAAYTQLRLAREIAGDQRLPWERPRPQPRLSPLRVRRGFPRLLCTLGSPATTPKPLRALPRPTHGPLLWTRDALPGDQEASHQAQEEAEQDHQSHLSGSPSAQAPRPRPTANSARPPG